jgi:primosomal protein N''
MHGNDLIRELQKLEATLSQVDRHLSRQSESNAALHLAERVMYSPLATEVAARLQEVRRTLTVLQETDEAPQIGRR